MKKFQIIWMDALNTVIGRTNCQAESFGDVIENLPKVYKALSPEDRANITGIHMFKELPEG